MKKIKIIDSTIYFGKAEKEVMSADFSNFPKLRGVKASDILSIDIHSIQKKYNIAGFVFGNFVTQKERYYSLFIIEKQLEFLSKIAKTKNLGKGVLKIGIGANGSPGSLAHYNPNANFININKGGGFFGKNRLQGENSFAHEYAHFLDNYYANKHAKRNVFASSEAIKEPNKNIYTKFQNIALSNKDYIVRLSNATNYWRYAWEIFARLFEVTVCYMAMKDKEYSIYFPYRYSRYVYLTKQEIEESNAYKLLPQLIRV